MSTRYALAAALLALSAAGCGSSSSTNGVDTPTWDPPSYTYSAPTATTSTTPTLVPVDDLQADTDLDHDRAIVVDRSPRTATRTTTKATTKAAPKAATKMASKSSGGGYYKNCAAARSAGAAPLHRGDAGYRSGLDRDGDGVACE